MPRRASPTVLSQRRVDRIRPGQWLSESLGYGHGSLQVRGTPRGGRYYLRTVGARSRVFLGPTKGRDRLTLDQARQRAWMASMTIPTTPSAARKTLGRLLTAYCETLAANGRASQKPTLALFHRHLRDAFPQLWAQIARTVTAHQFVEVLDRLVAQDKLPTAEKLRTSLNAAFNRALRADFCVQSSLMRGFGLTRNPMAPVGRVLRAGAESKRVLSLDELRAIWHALGGLESPVGGILSFHLLTGGQRLAQLLRARRANLQAGGVMLYDPKGRRTAPRPHLVPIIGGARQALAVVPDEGPYLLIQKPGAAPPHPATLFRHLQSLAGPLVRAGKMYEGINFATLRRTIETQLAAAGVPAPVRAHLQSHGLDGIQARHYDQHSYFEEKRAALETLYRLMTES